MPMLAVIHHQGRHSGRAFTTPLAARPTADGFVIPLTFGEKVGWIRDVVARFILEKSPIFRSSLPADARVEVAEVNGQQALITRSDKQALNVLTIDVEDQQIKAIRCMANPDKVAHI